MVNSLGGLFASSGSQKVERSVMHGMAEAAARGRVSLCPAMSYEAAPSNFTSVGNDDDAYKSGQRAFLVWLMMMGSLASCFLLYVLTFGRNEWSSEWGGHRHDADLLHHRRLGLGAYGRPGGPGGAGGTGGANARSAAAELRNEIRTELRPFSNAPLVQGPMMFGADTAPSPVVEIRVRRPSLQPPPLSSQHVPPVVAR